jgi:hypothetical protein
MKSAAEKSGFSSSGNPAAKERRMAEMPRRSAKGTPSSGPMTKSAVERASASMPVDATTVTEP